MSHNVISSETPSLPNVGSLSNFSFKTIGKPAALSLRIQNPGPDFRMSLSPIAIEMEAEEGTGSQDVPTIPSLLRRLTGFASEDVDIDMIDAEGSVPQRPILSSSSVLYIKAERSTPHLSHPPDQNFGPRMEHTPTPSETFELMYPDSDVECSTPSPPSPVPITPDHPDSNDMPFRKPSPMALSGDLHSVKDTLNPLLTKATLDTWPSIVRADPLMPLFKEVEMQQAEWGEVLSSRKVEHAATSMPIQTQIPPTTAHFNAMRAQIPVDPPLMVERPPPSPPDQELEYVDAENVVENALSGPTAPHEANEGSVVSAKLVIMAGWETTKATIAISRPLALLDSSTVSPPVPIPPAPNDVFVPAHSQVPPAMQRKTPSDNNKQPSKRELLEKRLQAEKEKALSTSPVSPSARKWIGSLPADASKSTCPGPVIEAKRSGFVPAATPMGQFHTTLLPMNKTPPITARANVSPSVSPLGAQSAEWQEEKKPLITPIPCELPATGIKRKREPSAAASVKVETIAQSIPALVSLSSSDYAPRSPKKRRADVPALKIKTEQLDMDMPPTDPQVAPTMGIDIPTILPINMANIQRTETNQTKKRPAVPLADMSLSAIAVASAPQSVRPVNGKHSVASGASVIKPTSPVVSTRASTGAETAGVNPSNKTASLLNRLGPAMGLADVTTPQTTATPRLGSTSPPPTPVEATASLPTGLGHPVVSSPEGGILARRMSDSVPRPPVAERHVPQRQGADSRRPPLRRCTPPPEVPPARHSRAADHRADHYPPPLPPLRPRSPPPLRAPTPSSHRARSPSPRRADLYRRDNSYSKHSGNGYTNTKRAIPDVPRRPLTPVPYYAHSPQETSAPLGARISAEWEADDRPGTRSRGRSALNTPPEQWRNLPREPPGPSTARAADSQRMHWERPVEWPVERPVAIGTRPQLRRASPDTMEEVHAAILPAGPYRAIDNKWPSASSYDLNSEQRTKRVPPLYPVVRNGGYSPPLTGSAPALSPTQQTPGFSLLSRMQDSSRSVPVIEPHSPQEPGQSWVSAMQTESEGALPRRPRVTRGKVQNDMYGDRRVSLKITEGYGAARARLADRIDLSAGQGHSAPFPHRGDLGRATPRQPNPNRSRQTYGPYPRSQSPVDKQRRVGSMSLAERLSNHAKKPTSLEDRIS